VNRMMTLAHDVSHTGQLRFADIPSAGDIALCSLLEGYMVSWVCPTIQTSALVLVQRNVEFGRAGVSELRVD